MRRMWKKIIAGMFACTLMTLPLVTHAVENEMSVTLDVVSDTENGIDVSMVETEPEVSEGFVYDYAGLLTEDEIEALEMQIADMKEKTGWDILVVTTDYAEGKSAAAYADDFYDERTADDSDGILVLIDMDNREIYISTCGKAIRYLSDERIDRVLDDGFYYVSMGEYQSCLSAMLSSAEYYYDAGIRENQYNYDVETGAISEYRTLTWMEVVPILMLSVGVGLVIYVVVVKSYSMKGGRYEYPYMKYGKLDLTAHEDRFLRAHTTHQRIQTSSSGSSHRSGGGGRSSVHRSSGGRSHGGGGRKF